jgi:hypothetical protein
MTLRHITRWFCARFRPSPAGLPPSHYFLCLVCNEVSRGRQTRCVETHTHKIVNLEIYHSLHHARIKTLLQHVRARDRTDVGLSALNTPLVLTHLERKPAASHE